MEWRRARSGWGSARAAGEVGELALFARNLTDEEIVRNGIDFNNLTGMRNEPRVVGMELVTRF